MTVRFKIRDATSDRHAVVSEPSDRTVGQVRPKILEALGLSIAAHEFGEEVTYTLYNESVPPHVDPPILSDDLMVGSALQNDDEVRVVPNVVAGEKK